MTDKTHLTFTFVAIVTKSLEVFYAIFSTTVNRNSVVEFDSNAIFSKGMRTDLAGRF